MQQQSMPQKVCVGRPSGSSSSSTLSSGQENFAGSASKIPVATRRQVKRMLLQIVTTQTSPPSSSPSTPPTPRSKCTATKTIPRRTCPPPSRRSFCSSTSSEDSPPASPTWSTASSSKSLRCPCLAKQGTSTVVHSELGSSMRGGRKQSVQESPPSSPIFKAPFIVGTASSSSSCYQLHANVQSLLHTVKVNYPMYHSLVMAVVAAPGGTTNMCQKLIAAFDERIKLIENAMDNLWRISKKHKGDAVQNQLIAEKFYHLYDEVDRCREKRWDLSYLTYSLNEKGNALSLPRNRISQIKLIQKVFADKSL